MSSWVRINCKECGRGIRDEQVPEKLGYDNWILINRKRKFFCRGCRRNVKTAFELHD